MKDTIKISEDAKKRIHEILQNKTPNNFLRVIVQSGGCAGFQSFFKIDDKISNNDIKIEETYCNSKIIVVVDEISLNLIAGSTVQFTNNIMGSYFWLDVPNAESKCGCGSSFAL